MLTLGNGRSKSVYTSLGRELREKFGLCLMKDGRYNEAEILLMQVTKEYEELHGKEHLVTLTSVSNLAVVLEYQGKYEAAEKLIQRALEG